MNVAVRKKLLPSNPGAGVEFPVAVKGLFRPHYMDPVDLENAVVWISDSKTANGVAEVPLTEIAVKALRDQ